VLKGNKQPLRAVRPRGLERRDSQAHADGVGIVGREPVDGDDLARCERLRAGTPEIAYERRLGELEQTARRLTGWHPQDSAGVAVDAQHMELLVDEHRRNLVVRKRRPMRARGDGARMPHPVEALREADRDVRRRPDLAPDAPGWRDGLEPDL